MSFNCNCTARRKRMVRYCSITISSVACEWRMARPEMRPMLTQVSPYPDRGGNIKRIQMTIIEGKLLSGHMEATACSGVSTTSAAEGKLTSNRGGHSQTGSSKRHSIPRLRPNGTSCVSSAASIHPAQLSLKSSTAWVEVSLLVPMVRCLLVSNTAV